MLKRLSWLIAVLIVIIVSTLVSFKVKSSFIVQPSLSELKDTDCIVEYCWLDDEDYDQSYPKINNLSDLENNSEIILKVKSTDDGEDAAYSLIRKCTVISSLKGNIPNDTIYIYEPSYPSGNRYWCHQGYIAMEKDTEYIVFLNKIENSEYAKNEKLKNGYTFTNPYVSKYILGKKATLVDFEANNYEVYYNEVSDIPMLFDTQKYLDLYNTLLSDIENKYS